MILKVFYLLFSGAFLIYLLWPGPSSVEDFGPLPSSNRSDEPGDTVQVSDVAAYYSNFFREEVVPFYNDRYQSLAKLPFLPLRLNHPPEFAYTAIKDQTKSTYLEELVYPLRDSLYINGFEPHYPDGQIKWEGATDIVVNGVFYDTKTTIRFYSSPIWARIFSWIGINLTILGILKVSRKILK